jgi:hypothetical protein
MRQAIGAFLVAILNASAAGAIDTADLIAVLNAIIDIYADETRIYDAVFVQNDFLQSLTACVGTVRAKVKSVDKRKERDLRVRGDEVCENLVAFIKYRRSLRR